MSIFELPAGLVIARAHPDEDYATWILQTRTEARSQANVNEALGITEQVLRDSSPISEEAIAAEKNHLLDCHFFVSVAWVNGERAGYAVANCQPEGGGGLTHIDLHEDYRGQGVGRVLMAFSLGKFKPGLVTANVPSYNQSTIEWFERQGFNQDGPVYSESQLLCNGATIPETRLITYVSAPDRV